MSDDISDIAAYYNREAENEHGRLERHQLEYELTWRYLERFLPPGGTILEIGAATGRYTLELARRGYALTAVDLSDEELGLCRENLQTAGLAGQVRLLLADARDLSPVEKPDFDAVLLMGPLYHLVLEADRQAAVRQAFNHLRQGGIIFTTFISRFGILGDLLRNDPDWMDEADDVRSILERGRDPEDYPRGGFRGYFATAEEIPPLHETIGFETLVFAGLEPAISADDESYNQLEDKHRKLWLDVLERISTEPSLIGASRHLLYVGRKP